MSHCTAANGKANSSWQIDWAGKGEQEAQGMLQADVTYRRRRWGQQHAFAEE